MNGFQKVIKYCAIAFAAFLSVTIISSILVLIFHLTSNLSLTIDGKEYAGELKTVSKEYTTDEISEKGIRNISVDCSAEIFVVEGSKLSIVAENVTDDYEIELSGSTLSLKSKQIGFFNWVIPFITGNITEKATVTVTVPTDFHSDKFEIYSGSGKVKVDELDTDNFKIHSGSGRVIISSVKTVDLELKSGSGSVEVKDCNAEKSDIDTGSGKVVAENSSLGRLKLVTGSGSVELECVNAEDAKIKSGSGKVTYKGELLGDSKVDTGSGSVSLSLKGNVDDYEVSLDSGSGSLWLNGDKKSDGTYGRNIAGSLDLETGSGRVTVDFSDLIDFTK